MKNLFSLDNIANVNATKNYLLRTRHVGRVSSLVALAFAVFLAVTPATAQAQTAGYFFSSRQGTFTPLTDATAVTSLADDDALSGSLPVGFDFTFYGTTYSTLKASSNGFLTFNPAHTDPDLYENEIAGTSLTHAIMPFWDDLDGSTTGAQASYKVTGSSPNRVYTFEWSNFESLEVSSANGKISFQVSLHETSNMIELVYGPGVLGSGSNASIGIKGAATDFFSLAGSGTSPMRSADGTDDISTRPSNGQVYQFALTPPSSMTNAAPVITSNGGGSAVTVSVAENQTAVTTVVAMDADTGQTVTLALSGDDAALFSLSSSGELTFNTAPDYENPGSASGSNTYSVTVTATDDGTPEMSVMQTLTITVTDTDEVLEYFFSSRQGTFTPLTDATAVTSLADDDALSGSLPVGFDFTFYGTTYSTLKASSNGFLTFNPAHTDPDLYENEIAGTSLTHAIMPFWDDLDGSTTGAQASYKVTGSSPNRVYTFEWLTFESVEGAGKISFQVSLHETSNMIELVYGPGAPGSPIDVSIGIKGVATDFFSLAGSGTSPMRSADGTDDISTRPSNGQVYQFALTPPSSMTNAAPVITSNGGGSAVTVSVAENQTAVTTVVAMDADTGQTIAFTLSGDDAGLFSITPAGALTFTTAPDYENPGSASGSNTYSVTVTATDDGTPEMSVMQTLTITVTDTDEVLEYFFSSRQGTFTPLTDATAVTSLADDDALSGSLPVGFDFTFYGTTYSTLKASSNGFLTFNPAHTDPDLYENEIAGTSLTHAIMPFWDDLDGSTTGAQASYKVTGSSPNRVYTFEWLTFESVEGAGKISFQVSLHETSNMIELVYGPGAPGSPIDVSIGIKGVATDFFSLAGSGTSPMRSVGGTDLIATRPSIGQVYQFALTPPPSVTNVAPVITSNGGGSTATVAVAENQTAVTTVVAMDADTGQTVTLALSGDDVALFSLSSSGALTFTTAPDYETPSSASGSHTRSPSPLQTTAHPRCLLCRRLPSR